MLVPIGLNQLSSARHPSWVPHCAGTLEVVAAMSQTWLHPLLKKVLPAQGEVSGRGMEGRGSA